jgi:glycosyltransferase involved in cell wall biosynthesis
MSHDKNLASEYSDYFVSNVDYHDEKGIKAQLKTAMDFIHNREANEKFLTLLKQVQPDIVHFHNIYHQLTPSIIRTAKLQGCKTVLTAHDTKIVCPNYTLYQHGQRCEACVHGSVWNVVKNRCPGSLGKSVLMAAEALYQNWQGFYRELDVIISPSEFLARFIEQKLPDNQIVVVPNGMNDDIQNMVNEKGEYFLYLGRISQEKGVKTLAQAHQKMSIKFPLKVAGVGPLLDELQQGFPDVEWLGFQQGDALVDLMRHAKAIIVPSECYENCSMAVIESFAYGKPVIGANIGGIPEQVRPEQEGWLFESGNADDLAEKMTACVADEANTLIFGHQARQRFECKYSLKAHREGLMQIYTKLLASNTMGPKNEN